MFHEKIGGVAGEMGFIRVFFDAEARQQPMEAWVVRFVT
jgi:hypothetical protein